MADGLCTEVCAYVRGDAGSIRVSSLAPDMQRPVRLGGNRTGLARLLCLESGDLSRLRETIPRIHK
jgi:hypothetical protein